MKLLSAAVLLLAFAFASKATTLSGTVRDPEGAVIAKAHVVIHWDPAGAVYLGDNVGIKKDITLSSDSDGNFSLDLPPGFYDVFVTATAFTPHCEKIRLKDKPLRFRVKLRASPVASKELD